MKVIIAIKGYFKDRNIVKRIFCIMLCVLIVSLTIYIQKQECYAFVPLIIAGVEIAPEVVAGGLALLAAAGITFSTSQDAKNAFTQMWLQAGENLRNNLSALGTGIVSVSDSLWSSVIGWVNGKFYPGANAATTGIAWITDNGISYPVTKYNSSLSAGIAALSTLTWKGTTYTPNMLASNSSYDTWTILTNGSDSNAHIDVKHGTSVTMCVLVSYLTVQIYLYYTNINGNLTRSAFNSLSGAWTTDIQNFYNGTTSTTYNYTGESILNTINYDYKTASGTRTLSVPTNPDDVLGKTSSQVQNPVIPYSGSWEGTFRKCASAGDYVFNGTGTYTGVMSVDTTGTWKGQWIITTTGQRVWTGTYTAADATTWTGTATEVLPEEITPGTDYPKWKIPADTLKNKFPFSIPWDLKNAVTSLVTNPEAPHWTINFPSNVFVGGGSFTIDFTQFETWAKIIRWGIMIIFNVFLILATRKIIGAGGG